MSRDMRDVSPGTYVVNPGTISRFVRARFRAGFAFLGRHHFGPHKAFGASVTYWLPKPHSPALTPGASDSGTCNQLAAKPGKAMSDDLRVRAAHGRRTGPGAGRRCHARVRRDHLTGKRRSGWRSR